VPGGLERQVYDIEIEFPKFRRRLVSNLRNVELTAGQPTRRQCD